MLCVKAQGGHIKEMLKLPLLCSNRGGIARDPQDNVMGTVYFLTGLATYAQNRFSNDIFCESQDGRGR